MKTLCNIVGCDEVPFHRKVRIQYGNVRIVLRSWVAVSIRILVTILERKDELRIESDVSKNVEVRGCKVLG